MISRQTYNKLREPETSCSESLSTTKIMQRMDLQRGLSAVDLYATNYDLVSIVLSQIFAYHPSKGYCCRRLFPSPAHRHRPHSAVGVDALAVAAVDCSCYLRTLPGEWPTSRKSSFHKRCSRRTAAAAGREAPMRRRRTSVRVPSMRGSRRRSTKSDRHDAAVHETSTTRSPAAAAAPPSTGRCTALILRNWQLPLRCRRSRWTDGRNKTAHCRVARSTPSASAATRRSSSAAIGRQRR